jgi:arylsulfatase A-like enzyme
MNAICLVIDGLQAGYLGAYGNTWLATPELDRLAASGFVFDQAYVDSPRLESLYRAYWSGYHAQVKPAVIHTPGLPQQLAEKRVHTLLISDDALIADHPLAGGFGERFVVRAPEKPNSDLTHELADTEQAFFFAELIGQLGRMPEPFLLWGHTRGLTGAWDAPWDLRARLLAEEEDDVESVRAHLAELRHAPHTTVAADVDPDDLLALRLAYAAQVQVLDTCVAACVQSLDELAHREPTLLIVLGARGFALGLHQRVGHERPLLREELAHVPWMLRFSDRRAATERSQALVQPADLAATLGEWFELSAGATPGAGSGQSLLGIVHGKQSAGRDRILLTDEASMLGIRTPGWYLTRDHSLAEQVYPPDDRLQLFAKPDDRWEINEVATRCPEVASDLDRALDELVDAVSTNRSEPLAPLERVLREGIS